MTKNVTSASSTITEGTFCQLCQFFAKHIVPVHLQNDVVDLRFGKLSARVTFRRDKCLPPNILYQNKDEYFDALATFNESRNASTPESRQPDMKT